MHGFYIDWRDGGDGRDDGGWRDYVVERNDSVWSGGLVAARRLQVALVCPFAASLGSSIDRHSYCVVSLSYLFWILFSLSP